MKLASLAHGRDGRLVVVSRDLTRATDAFPVVPTLQAALDDWPRHAPRLADLAEGLAHGSVPSFRFHEHDCAAPLPRAYQWLDARAAAAPEGLRIVRRAGDALLGPRRAVYLVNEEAGIAFEAGIAVLTGDVPRGVSREEALARIRLVMLVDDVGLPDGMAGQATGELACSPVVVTPDELGAAWQGGRIGLPLMAQVNGAPAGAPDAHKAFDFGALIARAAATRALSAGTIVAAGSDANRAAPLLRFGDTIRIAMKDASGHSLFGAIEQEILPHG